MFRHLTKTAVVLFASLCLPLCAPTEARADGTSVAIAKMSKDAKKKLEQCYKQAFAEFKAAMKALKADVKAGNIEPEAAVEAANLLAAELSVHLDAHVTFVMTDFLAEANGLVAGLGGDVPSALLAGSCGALDSVLGAIDGKMNSFIKKAKMELANLNKVIVKINSSVKIAVNVQIFMNPPPKPVPANPAPEPKKLKLTSVGSANASNVANDGKISLHGVAPALGMVQVTLHGPNGETITQMVNVNPDCTFDFASPNAPGDGPGNLAEGNWRIDVTQGAQSVSKFHGV